MKPTMPTNNNDATHLAAIRDDIALNIIKEGLRRQAYLRMSIHELLDCYAEWSTTEKGVPQKRTNEELALIESVLSEKIAMDQDAE